MPNFVYSFQINHKILDIDLYEPQFLFNAVIDNVLGGHFLLGHSVVGRVS